MRIYEIGDAVAVNVDLLFPQHQQRHTGTVTEVHGDGQITAEFPQPDGYPPMQIAGPAEHFISVRTEPLDDEVRQLRVDLAKAQRERDSLARRCAVRFEKTERLRAALVALNTAASEQEEPSKALLDASGAADELLGTATRPSLSEGGADRA